MILTHTNVDKAKEIATDQLLENGEPKSDYKPPSLFDEFLSDFEVFKNWYGDAVTDHHDPILMVIQAKLNEADDADLGRFMRETINNYIQRASEAAQ